MESKTCVNVSRFNLFVEVVGGRDSSQALSQRYTTLITYATPGSLLPRRRCSTDSSEQGSSPVKGNYVNSFMKR